MKRKDMLWTLIVCAAIAIVVYRWADPDDRKYKTCEDRGGIRIENGCINQAKPDPRAAEPEQE